jgi:hypothetical protein
MSKAIQQDANEQQPQQEQQEQEQQFQQQQHDLDDDPIEAIARKVEEQRGQQAPAGEVQDDVNDIDKQVSASGVSLIDNPDNFRVKVKLEGQEEELGLTEVLRGYQKEAVATRRLNEGTRLLREAEEKAARLLREAEEKAKEVIAKAAATGGEQQQQDTGAADKTADDKQETAKKAIGALMEGDEEAAAAALAELAGGREATQVPDTNEVAAAVKQQLEVDRALTEFQQSHSDVLADPYLADMTNRHLQEEIAAGIHPDYATALKAAGDRTRDWMKRIAGGTQETGSTTENGRVALKERMEQIPSMSASAGSHEEPVETSHDVIAEMRKQRGLA